MQRAPGQMMPGNGQGPLKICLLSYRSNPHSGGQGVYLKNLSRSLKDLGHQVEVISGPPDPRLDADIPVLRLPCLDLYNPADPFRLPSFKELCHPLNFLEWLGVSTMGFPEPFVFGLKAYIIMRNRLDRYDIVHDNQSLSYGIWAISKFIPTVATIHHPISVDREIAIRSVSATWKKMKHMRWYSFLGMQKRVAKTLSKIITVSNCAREDISRAFKIPKSKFVIAPNGINTTVFRPRPAIAREKNRVIVTNSADIALKGLYYLLEAIAQIAKNRSIKLVVVGKPKENGGIVKRVAQLGIGPFIQFTGRIGEQEFVDQYARASVAVVPSVYEGFGLPAGEAMACGVPVVSTTGGALPEVVGDAGVLIPPADPAALVDAITALLDNPERAAALGYAGYVRVQKYFTWQKAAQATTEAYTEAIVDHRRF